MRKTKKAGKGEYIFKQKGCSDLRCRCATVGERLAVGGITGSNSKEEGFAVICGRVLLGIFLQ